MIFSHNFIKGMCLHIFLHNFTKSTNELLKMEQVNLLIFNSSVKLFEFCSVLHTVRY